MSSSAVQATARDHEEQVFETSAGIEIEELYTPDYLGHFDAVRDRRACRRSAAT